MQKNRLSTECALLEWGGMAILPILTSSRPGINIQFWKGLLALSCLTLVSCFSVEFVQEGSQKETVLVSHKPGWEQIEILKHPPKRRNYKTYGRVIVRNFGDGRIEKFYYEKIKKELFDRGMDGMYLANIGTVPVPPTIFQTGTTEGYTTSMAEIAKDAKVLEGVAFRYREREEE
ncbi:hypothetical protein LEP1GSC185_2483 [Leptospira licerasiae serovar Varillal str. VAR 010]|uniref:Uncharacterized protein n=1 Tax=Leptospira licerasiae str. MMD4847 TaxID=1049971 RepID=A0ABN0H843_9LEPT|nr:hypothetical protein LEP1GSC185_2483 [Leptospira licerasiae serovar Varillal str. VAR 010]EJZ41737.1 hypothetical protein LEP1GSC178_0257 [Leptospira licerasiae str. MMD4847]